MAATHATPPENYRTRESTQPRAGSPPRDMMSFHMQTTDHRRIAIARHYHSKKGHIVPLWEMLERILDESTLVQEALEAEARRGGGADGAPAAPAAPGGPDDPAAPDSPSASRSPSTPSSG